MGEIESLRTQLLSLRSQLQREKENYEDRLDSIVSDWREALHTEKAKARQIDAEWREAYGVVQSDLEAVMGEEERLRKELESLELEYNHLKRTTNKGNKTGKSQPYNLSSSSPSLPSVSGFKPSQRPASALPSLKPPSKSGVSHLPVLSSEEVKSSSGERCVEKERETSERMREKSDKYEIDEKLYEVATRSRGAVPLLSTDVRKRVLKDADLLASSLSLEQPSSSASPSSSLSLSHHDDGISEGVMRYVSTFQALDDEHQQVKQTLQRFLNKMEVPKTAWSTPLSEEVGVGERDSKRERERGKNDRSIFSLDPSSSSSTSSFHPSTATSTSTYIEKERASLLQRKKWDESERELNEARLKQQRQLLAQTKESIERQLSEAREIRTRSEDAALFQRERMRQEEMLSEERRRLEEEKAHFIAKKSEEEERVRKEVQAVLEAKEREMRVREEEAKLMDQKAQHSLSLAETARREALAAAETRRREEENTRRLAIDVEHRAGELRRIESDVLAMEQKRRELERGVVEFEARSAATRVISDPQPSQRHTNTNFEMVAVSNSAPTVSVSGGKKDERESQQEPHNKTSVERERVNEYERERGREREEDQVACLAPPSNSIRVQPVSPISSALSHSDVSDDHHFIAFETTTSPPLSESPDLHRIGERENDSERGRDSRRRDGAQREREVHSGSLPVPDDDTDLMYSPLQSPIHTSQNVGGGGRGYVEPAIASLIPEDEPIDISNGERERERLREKEREQLAASEAAKAQAEEEEERERERKERENERVLEAERERETARIAKEKAEAARLKEQQEKEEEEEREREKERERLAEHRRKVEAQEAAQAEREKVALEKKLADMAAARALAREAEKEERRKAREEAEEAEALLKKEKEEEEERERVREAERLAKEKERESDKEEEEEKDQMQEYRERARARLNQSKEPHNSSLSLSTPDHGAYPEDVFVEQEVPALSDDGGVPEDIDFGFDEEHYTDEFDSDDELLL